MLILGGTGEVGRQAVAAALADSRVSHVLSFGRRPPPVPADAPGHEKLQHTSLDFDALLAEVRQGYDGSEAKKLSGSAADSVVIALGTTRGNAGSAEAFELIDREYVLAAAKAARVPEKTQTVVYVSVSAARVTRGSCLTGSHSKITIKLTCNPPSRSPEAPTRARGSCTPNRRD